MGLLHTFGLSLLYATVLLAILPFTSYYINYKENEENLRNALAGSPFFISHVLDPSVDGHQHTSWNRNQWVEWLNRREVMHAKANKNPGRNPLTNKGINTVLISTASEFHNAFQGQRYTYNSNPGRGQPNSERNTFWGETPFYSYIFLRQGANFRVYRCPPMYVAVKFVGDKPVHMPITARRRDSKEMVKVSKDCDVVA